MYTLLTCLRLRGSSNGRQIGHNDRHLHEYQRWSVA